MHLVTWAGAGRVVRQSDQQQVAGRQGHEGADVGDQGGGVPRQSLRRPGMNGRAVDRSADAGLQNIQIECAELTQWQKAIAAPLPHGRAVIAGFRFADVQRQAGARHAIERMPAR